MKLHAAVVGASLGSLALLALPSCGVGYVLRSGYYQAELMASRQPVDKVLASGRLSAGQEQRLRLIGNLKTYGAQLGLAATDNYDTVALDWPRTIWNLTACDPLAFEPRTWWFPIVGELPYLGYFVEDHARVMEQDMLDEGLDVYVRTAGAYSTLGWFRDPVLPSMLLWNEPDLAETVFHELAHATLWIPGSAMFNESFAEVVGVAAMHNYMLDTYGADSKAWHDVQVAEADYRAYTQLLHGLCAELEALFASTLSDNEKLARKEALYASIPERIAASAIIEKSRYTRWATAQPWNNARAIQFRTYNAADDDFAAVLAPFIAPDGRADLPGFITAIQDITRPNGKWAEEPFAALKGAAG